MKELENKNKCTTKWNIQTKHSVANPCVWSMTLKLNSMHALAMGKQCTIYDECKAMVYCAYKCTELNFAGLNDLDMWPPNWISTKLIPCLMNIHVHVYVPCLMKIWYKNCKSIVTGMLHVYGAKFCLYHVALTYETEMK